MKDFDKTALNIATYNDDRIVADATADSEDYLPSYYETEMFKYFNSRIEGKDILDLGSGPGILAKYYSDLGYNVKGIDFSEKMVESAKKRCEKCQFITKNILELSPDDGQFDGVVAMHVLQYVEGGEIVDLFKRVRDVLKEKGQFLLIFTNTCHPKSGINETSVGLQEYWLHHTVEEIAPLFAKAGLKIVKFEEPQPENEESFFFVAERA